MRSPACTQVSSQVGPQGSTGPVVDDAVVVPSEVDEVVVSTAVVAVVVVVVVVVIVVVVIVVVALADVVAWVVDDADAVEVVDVESPVVAVSLAVTFTGPPAHPTRPRESGNIRDQGALAVIP